jgi:NAD-dependent SIR2 family protein deacetylase
MLGAMAGLPHPVEPSGTSKVDAAVAALAALLAGRRWVALTGAGCSTESGIPDYRGNGRPPARSPIQHDAFIRRADVRQRYWARATVGWARFSQARPNPAHHALSAMERAGHLRGVITQNVDRLHHAAGSRRVIELHGALADVRCLACGVLEPRAALHERLLAANPTWLDTVATVAPDGDADLPASQVSQFHVLGCLACAGALMPDVVFFGGTVAETKVAASWALVDEADVLVVVGSSLAVYSGWRFVRGAAERGIPVVLINLGETRADAISHLRIEAPAGAVLTQLAARLETAR